jgi:hypothetical protein
VLCPDAGAAPASVTIAGSLQSEAGCAGDWDPACAATHLTYDSTDDVWQGSFSISAGSYEFKAAIDDSWDVNYGAYARQNGDSIPLSLPGATAVKFYYDDKSHWVTSNMNSVIAVVPGSFQSELGCPGDWDPSCLRSWLQDPDGDGNYSFITPAIPPGSYEAKVAINENWSENYGEDGIGGGANIPFSITENGIPLKFSYDAVTHILTIEKMLPSMISAAYDCAAGVLAITAINMAMDHSIDSGKLTLTGESSAAYTLTSGSFTPDNATLVHVVLNAVDKSAVNQLLNTDGTASAGGTTYNLSAADDWDSSFTADNTSDSITPVTVSNAAPLTTTTVPFPTTTTTSISDTACRLIIWPEVVHIPSLWPWRIFRFSTDEDHAFVQTKPVWGSDALKTVFSIPLRNGSIIALVRINPHTAVAGMYAVNIDTCTGYLELQER